MKGYPKYINQSYITSIWLELGTSSPGYLKTGAIRSDDDGALRTISINEGTAKR